MAEKSIQVTRHTIIRYRDRVFDPDRDVRSDIEIEGIINKGYSCAFLPKRIPDSLHCLVEFLDTKNCLTNSLF